MIPGLWHTGHYAHAIFCHHWGPQGATSTLHKTIEEKCDNINITYTSLDLWPVNFQRFWAAVLCIINVYMDDCFQSCQVPDLKISWSQSHWFMMCCNSKVSNCFQDVAFKFPIYKGIRKSISFIFFFFFFLALKLYIFDCHCMLFTYFQQASFRFAHIFLWGSFLSG